MHKKRKKIVSIIIVLLVCLSMVLGIIAGVRSSLSGAKVMVVNAADLNSYYWYDEDTMEGYVTSGSSQNIYLSDSETVNEVKVKEGQSVKKGDILLVYDTKQVELNLQKEQLAYAQIELAIQVASRNISTLSKITPVQEIQADTDALDGDASDIDASDTETPDTGTSDTEKPDTGGDGGGTGQPDDAGRDNPYRNVSAVSELTDQSKAYNDTEAEENLGSETNPYRFLCEDGVTVFPSFIRMMKEKGEKTQGAVYFVLEVREGNKGDGAVRKMWLQDASLLVDVSDNWRGSLVLASVSENKDSAENTDSDQKEDLTGFVRSSRRHETVLSASTGTDRENGTSDTASSETTADYSSSLISPDAVYTGSELKKAQENEKNTLSNLQLDLKEEELKIKKAQEAVDQGVAKASADGVVTKAGDPENPPKDGSAFLTVSAKSGITVRGGLSERKLGQLKKGDEIQVMSWQSGETYTAVVDEVSLYPDTTGMLSSSDSSSSVYPFTANIEDTDCSFTENEWLQITPVSKETDVQTDGFYLMKAFIRDDDGTKYVYKRNEDGTLKKQTIKVGKIQDNAYEILSGITEDDWLAFPYGKNVKDGAKTREGSVSDLYDQ